ncbi:hypothetical protein [Campylobacter estrildidarum]|nr:hypothetical protein [Campylobacter estrildidarum]
MFRLFFFIIFLSLGLFAKNFLDFDHNNTFDKEQNKSQENPLKRIKIPTH